MTIRSLQRHLGRLYDAVETELNFLLRRKVIRTALDDVRRYPLNLHLETANVCNAKCVFCAYPEMKRAKSVMPLDLFKRVIADYIAMGGHGVSLTPIVGEPFVDRHIFERMDHLQRQPGINQFYFYTNAILMRPEVSARLQAYAGKLHIFVSVGGFDRRTYHAIMGVDAFRSVRDNIRGLVEAKKRTGSKLAFTLALRCPPSSCSGPFWQECKELESEGLLQFEPVHTFDSWAGTIPPSALRASGLEPTPAPHKRGACALLFGKPVVLADGRVNACACRDAEAELIIGDLAATPLAELWGGQAHAEIIGRHENGDFPDVCRRCTWYISIYNTRRRHIRFKTFSS